MEASSAVDESHLRDSLCLVLSFSREWVTITKRTRIVVNYAGELTEMEFLVSWMEEDVASN